MFSLFIQIVFKIEIQNKDPFKSHQYKNIQMNVKDQHSHTHKNESPKEEENKNN